MGAVIITILKITGIVLLSVLALVLLILCLVLFVPIRYRIDAKKLEPDDDITGSVKITYLLHMISGGAVYDGELDKYGKIFGIKIWPKPDKEEDTGGVHEEHDTGGSSSEPASEAETVPEHTVNGEGDYSIDWNIDEDSAHNIEDTYQEEDDDESIFDICDHIIEYISEKYGDITGKYEKIRKEIRFWDKMANDTRNRNAVNLIKDLVIKLLKRIAPRKVKGLVHFGFDDPATTGKILMYLAMIYPVLPKKLKIEPDFEEPLVYGNCLIKGNITLFFPVVYFLRIYFNKDCKRMWRIYKKHSNG